MDSGEEELAYPISGRLHVDLRRLEWAQGLTEEALTAIANTAELVEFRAGEVVIEVDSQVSRVCFIITGRMQATLYDSLGNAIGKDTFVRGAVVGLFSLGLSDRSHLQVQATEPSTALRLALSDLLQLTTKHSDFQLALFRLAANVVKRVVMVDRSLPKPSVVGIIHHSEDSRPLSAQLARRLRHLDESPRIAGDDERWKPDRDIPFRLLVRGGGLREREDILRDWPSNGRVLVDVRADHPPEAMMRLLSYLDIALWCVRPQDVRTAVHALRELEQAVPRWRDKVRIVWLLDNNARVAPHAPELTELAERDFKITVDALGAEQGSLQRPGVERIVHHLRGVQIGLALGGGAARGMAHLGVLKALEEHGIYVDMLAGTSAGALTGTLYAAGLTPERLIQIFKADLQPSLFFRHLPGGSYWYLLYKYRLKQFEPMLRKYLSHATLEQLILPILTVSVDLVEGGQAVSERGDATNAILKSINLPPLALPIINSGHAWVDGGVLNNIPASVLVAKGCNFVIASSVTAKLERDFMEIRSKGRLASGFLSTPQVIMRQNMIQHYSVNSVGVQPADFMIAPDVTSFDLSEFTRADEMAVIGESATNASVAELRKMLSRLDSKLFGSS